MAGLRRSLELLEEEGSAEERLGRITSLSAMLWNKLDALPGVTPLLDGPPPAGLVSFQIGQGATEIDPAAVVQRLGAQQLWIRDLADPSCLRACTHICTTVDELEHLTHALNQEANPC